MVPRTRPASADIVATDLNPSMLARAAAFGTARPVEWRPADAMHLPFADASFDVVVCQFGVMFFPDKARAAQGARGCPRRRRWSRRRSSNVSATGRWTQGFRRGWWG